MTVTCDAQMVSHLPLSALSNTRDLYSYVLPMNHTLERSEIDTHSFNKQFLKKLRPPYSIIMEIFFVSCQQLVNVTKLNPCT